MATKLSDAQIEFLAKVTKWDSLLVPASKAGILRTAESLVTKGFLVKEVISVRWVRYSIPAALEASEDTPAEAPDVETLADELPAYPLGVDQIELLKMIGAYNDPAPRIQATTFLNSGGEGLVGMGLLTKEDNPGFYVVSLTEEGMKKLIELSPLSDDEQTGPDLTPDQQAALDTFNPAMCYLTMTPQSECQCAWCKLGRVESENAALKAQVAVLEAQKPLSPQVIEAFHALSDVMVDAITDEDYNKLYAAADHLWIALRPIVKAQRNKIDHAEIEARQSDDSENRNAGEGIYF